MATEDQQRQRFDEIVENLTVGDAKFRRLVGDAPTPLSAGARAAVLVTGLLAWGLLSVAMVAWGWPGVALTVAAVAAVAWAEITGRLLRLRPPRGLKRPARGSVGGQTPRPGGDDAGDDHQR